MRTAIARWVGLVVLLTGLTTLVTWPQVPRLADGVSDYGDPLYNAWALAWTAHALADRHDTLFDANIFHPEPNTLALTETILLPAVLVAPLAWAGAGPIALHNIVLLSSFVLSGLAMFLLVRSLTADAAGATVAAVAFALTPIRFDQYSHVQLQLTYLMPLALYFLHGALRADTGRGWRAAGLGASLGGLFLSCVYYTAFFATLLMVFTPVLLASTRPPRLRASVWPACVAAIVAAIVASPVAMAYQRNRAWAADRRIEDVARGSAAASDYLRAQNWNLLYGDPARRGPAERNLFTGYTLPALAAGALVASPLAAAPYAAAAAVGFDASLGVNGWTYPALYRLLSPFRTLRVPARFAMLVAIFLAVLAGLGVSALRARCRAPWARHAVLACALAGLVAESANRPLPLASMPAAIPGVYEYLATLPPGPVFEYPISHLEGRAGPQDATYMYYSTAHWKPLLNGYSSFAPASYFELRDRMAAFPQPESIAYLVQRGTRYVLAHERFYFLGGFEEDVAALDALPALRRLATFREARHLRSVVFEIVGYEPAIKP
jgi:hypothetical protein